MANFTGSSSSQEFAGDEFSNNLFSDLAPLLTLFGEQVTKQFLSMSISSSVPEYMDFGSLLVGMGWADNILLAMGPLGIMTIIVSAIRVGRVKMLKAMVGRARESQSDAEQELLSSTSDDVCELWSGHEIVRVMGQPAGMKTLVISDGEVLDIKSADDRGHLGRDSSLRLDDVKPLSDAAPNLALNVRNATAPSWELWTWAVVGIILQFIAVVIPGIATYVWKWPKADVQVQSYGYPCFVIGTTLVVLGTMVCGHVIEGVTDEHKFTKADNRDMQILRLQRACTVSDQHFSSYAIFNNEDNSSIRTSRLNAADYSSLAAISSLASVVGFIIQFVGLRALHWSATILQLGITIIMTGIRAWVRRGLAFDPVTHAILDGHEMAWLTLHIFSKKLRGMPGAGGATAQRNSQIGHIPFWDIPPHPELQGANEIIWEPIMGYDSYRRRAMKLFGRIIPKQEVIQSIRDVGIPMRELYMFQQLFTPLRIEGLVGVDLTTTKSQSEDDVSTALEVYKQIDKVMPAENAIINAASSLISVVDRVMNILCDVNAIKWKKEGIQIPQVGADKGDSDSKVVGAEISQVFWGFTISTRMPTDTQTQARRLYFRLERVVNDDPNTGSGPVRWKLHDRVLVAGVLSLWLYSMARRRSAIERFNSSVTRANIGAFNDVVFGRSGRIVGTVSMDNRDQVPHALSQWLGVAIREIPLPNGANIDPKETSDNPTAEMTWFLGMFLSPMAESDDTTSTPEEDREFQEGDVLVVQTREDSSLEMHFAQELFSLFILAMANNISQVLGETVRHSREDDITRNLFQPPISLENSVFSAIANEVVHGGLAHDTTEAYSLIIPAFHKLHLLPSPTVDAN